MTKLAVSNIAWSKDNLKTFELLSSLGINGVEVAPGKVDDGWENLTLKKMQNYRQLCEEFNLSIPSFQAFLFGKPELQLLGDVNKFKAMMEHIEFVAELAATAGAKILVYGAPKSRLLLNYSIEAAESLAIERLGKLADICWKYRVSIGLEAVPAIYGSEWLTSYKDSLRIVKAVDSPGLLFHLDTGCVFLNGDDITQAIETTGKNICHLHISQPQLADFFEPAEYHQDAAIALKRIGYSQWYCIEMSEKNSSLNSIKISVENATKIYS